MLEYVQGTRVIYFCLKFNIKYFFKLSLDRRPSDALFSINTIFPFSNLSRKFIVLKVRWETGGELARQERVRTY